MVIGPFLPGPHSARFFLLVSQPMIDPNTNKETPFAFDVQDMPGPAGPAELIWEPVNALNAILIVPSKRAFVYAKHFHLRLCDQWKSGQTCRGAPAPY